MGPDHVLDSFALLVLLQKEPGSEDVLRLLREAQTGAGRMLMTWVSVGEVAYIIHRRWGQDRVHQVLANLEAAGIAIVPVGRDLALQATAIKATHAIAFADAVAAALALTEQAVLVTGVPEFGKLEGSLSIHWLPAREPLQGHRQVEL